jgi:probable F420-dependent oxidoreductase
VEFGIQVASGQVPHEKSGIEAFVAEATMAEALGFSVVLAPDHYAFESLGVLQRQQAAYDVGFVLATLAQRTSRIRLGTQVMCMLFRHPAMAARLFAQIDEASDGRVVAGVGAGWTKVEFDMFGLEFPPISERLRIMDEAVAVMRGLWGEEPFSFEGKYFDVRDATQLPRPVQRPGPPILLGGSGNGILRRAGQWADIIHLVPAIGHLGTTTMDSVAAFTDAVIEEKLARVRAAEAEAGRPAGSVAYWSTIYNFAPTKSPAETRELAGNFSGVFQMSPAEVLRHPVVLMGTPEEMVEEILRRQEAHGLAMVTINFTSEARIRDFAEKVIPRCV